MGKAGATRNRRWRVLAAAVAAAAGAVAAPARAADTYWDPNPAPGVQGGNGAWNTSNSNWDESGVRGPWYNSHNDVAVFAGTAGGTVQVSGTVIASALRFEVPGYALTPSGTTAQLRLNDGSVIADVSALLQVPLVASGGLFKSGAGTLTLGGSNSLGSALSVAGGTVAFGQAHHLGAPQTEVHLSGGGRLSYTGTADLSFSQAHALRVDASGGVLELAAGEIAYGTAGLVYGPGTLTKTGAGRLRLTRPNPAFTGALTMVEGTLVLWDPGALNGRPLTLAGGMYRVHSDAPALFPSPVRVTGDAGLQVVPLAPQFATPGTRDVGPLTVDGGATLSVASPGYKYPVGTAALDLAGTVRVSEATLVLHGTSGGTGRVQLAGPPAGTAGVMATLRWTGGGSRAAAYTVAPDAAAGNRLSLAVDGGTALSFAGTWVGGDGATATEVALGGGSALALAAAARVNTLTPDRAALRPFRVAGDGTTNTFEVGPGFVADRTGGGAAADGFGAIEVAAATLRTHGSAGLPAVTKLAPGGGTHRAGSIAFTGTAAARWVVATADHQYDGGVRVAAPTTLVAEAALAHAGTVHDGADGQFQVSAAATLTKSGPGALALSGAQGYAPGAAMSVEEGSTRFGTDPGAGWYEGNYARGADGTITAPPLPAGTLALSVGPAAGGTGAASAAVQFAAPVSRVASLRVRAGGTARLDPGGGDGAALVTGALTVDPGGVLDLGAGRAVVDYSGAAGGAVLDAVAVLLRSGFNAGAGRWQGTGIVSLAARADAALAVGYADAADVLRVSGTQTAEFGPAAVDATAVLLRLTRTGDADLDGRVSFADFQRLERSFGKPGRWADGDFDYDGVVGPGDLRLLYANLGTAVGDGLAAGPAGEVPVPEPAAALWAAGALALLARRPKSKHQGPSTKSQTDSNDRSTNAPNG